MTRPGSLDLVDTHDDEEADMHPLILYDIARLEREHAVREAETQWHVRAGKGIVGRRRRRTVRLHRWLRPALPAPMRGAS